MFLIVFKIALLLMCFFTVLMGIMLGCQTLAFDNDRLFEVFDKILKWLTIIIIPLLAFVAGSLFVCMVDAIITNMI